MKKYLILYFSLFALWLNAGDVQNSALAVVLNNKLSYYPRAKQLAAITSNLQQTDVAAIHTFLDEKDKSEVYTIVVFLLHAFIAYDSVAWLVRRKVIFMLPMLKVLFSPITW